MTDTRTEWPLVSVILPTRGRPELVRESIAGVVGQTYPGEIACTVVHDQESEDHGLAELGRDGRRVTVTTNTHEPGLAGARNTGLEAVHGDFVATCDDDDVWHPEKLTAQVGRLLDEPDLMVVGSGIRLLLPEGRTAEWPGRSDRVETRVLLRNRVKELHSSTLVMRREVFDRAGGYDESLPGGYAEDYDWVLRAAKVGPIGIVREPLADIRKDGRSWYAGRAEQTAEALEIFLAKHPEIRTSRYGHARILGQIAYARSTLGQRREGARYALRAVTRWPASPYAAMALVHLAIGVDPRHLARLARLFGRGVA